MTVGSRSTNTALGTCFPAPVSLKKVLKESSPPPMVLSLGILPSGWIPCSRQYSSQHALPIWTPAWPTWTEIHSRCGKRSNHVKLSTQILVVFPYRSISVNRKRNTFSWIYHYDCGPMCICVFKLCIALARTPAYPGHLTHWLHAAMGDKGLLLLVSEQEHDLQAVGVGVE